MLITTWKGYCYFSSEYLFPKVEVIHSSIADVTVPELIPEKVDILITDSIDYGLLGESLLSTIEYTKQKLLKETGIVIPGKANVFAMGVRYRYEKCSGVDVSLVNAYIPKKGYSGIDFKQHFDKYTQTVEQEGSVAELVCVPMTDAFHVFSFDFNTPSLLIDGTFTQSVAATSSGVLTSFVFWFELELVPGVILSSSPFETDAAQKVIFLALPNY